MTINKIRTSLRIGFGKIGAKQKCLLNQWFVSCIVYLIVKKNPVGGECRGMKVVEMVWELRIRNTVKHRND